MIRIRKSLTADTRSAKTIVTESELLKSSKQHIKDVRKAMRFMSKIINKNAKIHDWTKIKYIKVFAEDFKETQINGTDFKMLPWFKLHVATERHHVNDFCHEDINLFDILERVADITMAGMGRTGKVFSKDLDPEILKKAYKNTIDLMVSNIKVIGGKI